LWDNRTGVQFPPPPNKRICDLSQVLFSLALTSFHQCFQPHLWGKVCYRLCYGCATVMKICATDRSRSTLSSTLQRLAECPSNESESVAGKTIGFSISVAHGVHMRLTEALNKSKGSLTTSMAGQRLLIRSPLL